MRKFLIDTRVRVTYPRQNITCIAFVAAASLVTTMIAAGIPVRRHPLRTHTYVIPSKSIDQNQFWELLQDLRFHFVAVVTFLGLSPGILQTFNVFGDWNNVNNKIETIAGGGSGAADAETSLGIHQAATGGGAGAYSASTNVFLTPGSTAPYQIGAGGTSVSVSINNSGLAGNGGGDSWFGASTLAGSLVGAKGGSGGNYGNPTASGAAGGAAASGIGAIVFSGGNGGDNTNQTRNATGGGGAAGPNGNGVSGVANATDGGAGDAGSGGTGGVYTSGNGTAGGNGTEFDSSHGSGGGGSRGLISGAGTVSGGAGGTYGGGGGAAADTFPGGTFSAISGVGSQGLIVVTYTPVPYTIFSMPMMGL